MQLWKRGNRNGYCTSIEKGEILQHLITLCAGQFCFSKIPSDARDEALHGSGRQHGRLQERSRTLSTRESHTRTCIVYCTCTFLKPASNLAQTLNPRCSRSFMTEMNSVWLSLPSPSLSNSWNTTCTTWLLRARPVTALVARKNSSENRETKPHNACCAMLWCDEEQILETFWDGRSKELVEIQRESEVFQIIQKVTEVTKLRKRDSLKLRKILE